MNWDEIKEIEKEKLNDMTLELEKVNANLEMLE